MKISGIYKIQSLIKPERCYIGSSICINLRWNKHLSQLKGNIHCNKKLQNHYNKYGEADLQFSILLGCEKEDLIKIEQYFLDSYNPWFNNLKIAGSPLGYKHSQESINNMRGHKVNLGRKVSDETKEKLRIFNRGKHLSEETKRKMSESRRIYYNTERGMSDRERFRKLYKDKKRPPEVALKIKQGWGARKNLEIINCN